MKAYFSLLDGEMAGVLSVVIPYKKGILFVHLRKMSLNNSVLFNPGTINGDEDWIKKTHSSDVDEDIAEAFYKLAMAEDESKFAGVRLWHCGQVVVSEKDVTPKIVA